MLFFDAKPSLCSLSPVRVCKNIYTFCIVDLSKDVASNVFQIGSYTSFESVIDALVQHPSIKNHFGSNIEMTMNKYRWVPHVSPTPTNLLVQPIVPGSARHAAPACASLVALNAVCAVLTANAATNKGNLSFLIHGKLLH